MTTSANPTGPVALRGDSGLVVQVNANGSIRRIDHGDVMLNLFIGSEIEGGPANLYLRRHGEEIESTPLLGPSSPATIELDEASFVARGEWRGIRFEVSLMLAQSASAWFWHVRLENVGTAPLTVDLVHAQDLALAHYGAVRMNEYYVSQYVDYTPLVHAERGAVLAVRQNLSMGGRHPWAALGSLGTAASFATDALDLHGLAARGGGIPAGLAAATLPRRRRQHEHSMGVLQEAPVRLEPGATAARGFFGWFEPDHPEASSPTDLAFVDRALALPEASSSQPSGDGSGHRPATTLFQTGVPLRALDLTEAEIARLFPGERRLVEELDGSTLSFFTGADRHVVMKAKELRVLRPHGQILRTGNGLVPDEASLTTTVWMAGVFHSLVTQGHVNLNRFLSATRSYLGLSCSTGQRVFVETPEGWRRLDVPSAFEMTPSSARWLYEHDGGLIEVRSRARIDRHELELALAVLDGPACRFLVSHQVALGGDDGVEAVPVRFADEGGTIVVRTVPDTDCGRRFPGGFFRIAPSAGTVLERVGGDEILFADGRSRAQPYLVVVTAPTRSAGLTITGGLVPAESTSRPVATREGAFWTALAGPVALHGPQGSTAARDVACIQDILPWFAHDAVIHYLAPRGLEQYSGGAWGTRDVCQGPVEWLRALGRFDPLRDLLLRVFGAQNPDGDWPQWFTFFERDRGIRAADSHGDIVFWPLLALGQYVLASDDTALLDVAVPFFHPEGDARAERAPILAHVERALDVIGRRTIPSTRLVAYGNGDWNDSLQPVDPAMRERLCSAWTVTLHVQMLTTLAAALRHVGRAGIAAKLEALVPPIRDDFQRLLVPDGTVAGFAFFENDGRVEPWLHPRDRVTGIRYRLLPMIHAILSDLFTPEQARAHVELIRRHLLGPDGARLFDRPPEYHGGPTRVFQRAESSSFFGREIGLMYLHAHLRYAEAMARYGDADAFFLALRQAIPIALHDVVPPAARRQANCYYSSSDAAFVDRYEAQARYGDVRGGRVACEGGWRVYSSGAGIAVRLVHECFLGLRRGRSMLGIDPVVPKGLDGLRADTTLEGRALSVVYRIAAAGHGPTALTLNGQPLPMTRTTNPYRTAGVTVPMAAVRERLREGPNELSIDLG
jgi:cellobiose phosphorylase